MEQLKGALLGQAPGLHENIGLGWEGLPGTNTLAYYEHLSIMAVKSFVTSGSFFGAATGTITFSKKNILASLQKLFFCAKSFLRKTRKKHIGTGFQKVLGQSI